MTIPNPTAPIVQALRSFPYTSVPYTNVTPFTIRDNATNISEIEAIKQWIWRDLIPHVDGTFRELLEAWVNNVDELITAVNNNLDELNADVAEQLLEQNTAITNQLLEQNQAIALQLSEQDQEVTQRLEDNLEAINEAVQQVINATIEVTDPIMTSVAENSDSNFRAVLLNTMGRVRPPASAVHTTHIQDAIDAAANAGVRRLELPPLVEGDSSVPWVVDGELVMPPDFEFDASRARIRQTVIDRPVFYVPPTSPGVTIRVGYCYWDGPRPAIEDYGTGTVHGAPERAAFSGIMSYAERGTFEGTFRGFRNGARLGTRDSVGIRRGNRVRIEVDDVDFGLVFFDQDHLEAEVRGRYVQTPGSDDPAHLVYGTRPVGVNGQVVVNGEAWDSEGGAAFFFRHTSNLVSESLVARNCSAVLNISNSNGDAFLGKVVGVALTRAYLNELGQPTYIEAVRGGVQSDDPTGPDRGSVTIDSLRIDIAPGSATEGVYRAVSAYRDWTIKEYEITYSTTSLTSGVSLIHAPTDRLILGPGSITNLDPSRATGLRGINFQAGSGHVLAAAPRIVGCTTGVQIQDGATGTFVVDEEIIEPVRPTDRKVIGRTGAGVVINGMGWARRINRWTAVPSAASTANAPMTVNTMYALPRFLESETTIDSFAVTVVTAQAGGLIRIGVYDDDRGAPGSLILEVGTVDASTVGTKTIDLANPLKVSRGPVHFGVVAQVASGIVLVGADGAAFDGNHSSPAGAISGQTTGIGGVSGPLPDPFGVVVSSSPIGPRLAFRVWNPA